MLKLRFDPLYEIGPIVRGELFFLRRRHLVIANRAQDQLPLSGGVGMLLQIHLESIQSQARFRIAGSVACDAV